jgi:hypothetical protein
MDMKYLQGSEKYIIAAVIFGVLFVITGLIVAAMIHNKFFR